MTPDRVHTIALIAAQLRCQDGMNGTDHPSTEYVKEALALYREAGKQVRVAYSTTTVEAE